MSNETSNTWVRARAWRVAGSLLVASALVGCGSDDDAPDPSIAGRLPQVGERPSTDVTLRRERVAVLFAKEEYDAALGELQPLLEASTPVARDHVVAAQIQLRLGRWDAATEQVEAALAADASNLGALYTRSRIALLEYELDDAIAGFERVLTAAPEDPASKLGISYASFLRWQDDEDENDMARARRLLDEVISLGLPNGVQWYVTAVYQRLQIARYTEESEESILDLQGLWDALNESGYKASTETNLDQGDLALVGPPEPYGTFPDAAPAAPTFGAPRTIAALPSGTEAVWMHDLDGDRTPDIVTRTGGAVAVHLRDRTSGALSTFELTEAGATGPVHALDLNQGIGGDTLDVLVVEGDRIRVLEQSDALAGEDDGPRWADSPVSIPAFGGAIRGVVPVDFDHEGDLDLFVVGEFGARLLRNDGAGAEVDTDGTLRERGTWTDATEAATLPREPLAWCLIEDFDGDNDVDLLCGGAEGVHLMDSQRRGLFVDRGARAFPDTVMPREPAVADFDGTGRPDLFVPGADGSTLWLRTSDDWTFHRIALHDARVPEGADVRVCDLDLDGVLDVVWSTVDGGAAGVLAIGLKVATSFQVPALDDSRGSLLALDVDTPDPYGELRVELCRISGSSLVAVAPEGELGNGIYLEFVGVKDNRQGIGAIVEVRARDVYQRRYWRGDAEVFGLGRHESANVVRVTWPNGVVQQSLDVAGGVTVMLDDPAFGEQPEGLIGSCPFLYTWNGETFEFISDVIGITPLGLPMAPGMLVPPDHDEYVLVRGDQLVVDANGELVLQFTEELREVTYLDRIRLDAIDHPEGTAVYPNERFTFPPFPEAHTHVVERAAQAQRVTGSDGAEWTDEVARIDMRHAMPFDRLGGQFLGLAEPHWLELEFDPSDLEGATKLRLIATGWFFWSDASVNMAAAGTPGVAFVPPILEVPGADGGWVPAGPPIGFPAGKSKTMVVDVTGMIDPKDPRFRIGSTLELYWDCLELAVCDDDAEVWTTSLEPAGAELWARGFSAPIAPERADLPLFFDWNRVEPRPRWNQHPGRYTRFGEVSPLLGEIDDRFVIMGSGDALTVRFDASTLPPVPEGYVRDWLVFLDGWAKDRDPNTHEALEVEPLPFHGMSGYPYGPDESFPSDPEHEAWRREWNTREGHDWIVPLSVRGQEEWRSRERSKSTSRR